MIERKYKQFVYMINKQIKGCFCCERDTADIRTTYRYTLVLEIRIYIQQNKTRMTTSIKAKLTRRQYIQM